MGETWRPDITVRSCDTPAERETFFQLAAETFVRNVPNPAAAADWRRLIEDGPDFHPGHIRGAFRDGQYLGGYLIDERQLCVGSARLRTGCIGGVVTHPAYRRQGVGTALMHDALAYAHARHHALLILNGAPAFYDPFGFIDIFDPVRQSIVREHITALPASPLITIRSATVADAPAILGLYRQHYGPYAGSFDRTVATQAHILRSALSVTPGLYRLPEGAIYEGPVVAVDTHGELGGYLIPSWGATGPFGVEAAASTWPAALALLQQHARWLETLAQPPNEVHWPLPSDLTTLYILAEHLAVQSQSYQRPHAGWMARPIDMPALMAGLLPLWRERWRTATSAWSGQINLSIEGQRWGLDLQVDRVDLHAAPSLRALEVQLSAHGLVQLIFGFRPVAWISRQPHNHVPDALIPVLHTLFAPCAAWIAPSDGC